MKKEWKDDLAVYKRMDAILATELDMWAIIEDFASTSGSVPLEGTTRWRLAVAAKRDPSGESAAGHLFSSGLTKCSSFCVLQLR